MGHPAEDKLLELELGLLDRVEEEKLKEHLQLCESCKHRYSIVKSDNAVIGDFDPEIELPEYHLPKRNGSFKTSFLKLAAVLLLGFIIGYGTSFISRPTYSNVIPQYHQPKPVSQSFMKCVSSEAVDMRVEFSE